MEITPMNVRQILITLRDDPEARAIVREVISPKPEPEQLYATTDQYAARTGVSMSTVKRWIRDGLPSSRNGNIRRVHVADADRWIREGGRNQRAKASLIKLRAAGGAR
jgi:excisionase family DNA binding protein